MKSSKVLKNIAFSLIILKRFPCLEDESVFIQEKAFGSRYFKGIGIYTPFYTTVTIYFKNNLLEFKT